MPANRSRQRTDKATGEKLEVTCRSCVLPLGGNRKTMNYKVKIIKGPGPFPDFRQIADMLWGYDVEYDSDGNCEYPADRNWTELYIKRRPSDKYFIDIYSDTETTIIESNDAVSANSVALFLIEWSGGDWVDSKSGKEIRESLIEHHGFIEKWTRGENSIWKMASKTNPYPNTNPPNKSMHRSRPQ